MDGRIDEKRFFDLILRQAAIIREQEFDLNQIHQILNLLIHLYKRWMESEPRVKIKDPTKGLEAIFELNVALACSYSNYRRANKNMWKTIFGWGTSRIPEFKMPELLGK